MTDYLWLAKRWRSNRGMMIVLAKNQVKQMEKRLLTLNQHSA